VVLIPTLAYAGIFNMLQQATTWVDDQQRLDQIYAPIAAMSRSDVRFLSGLESRIWAVMAMILLAVLLARQLRLWYQRRKGTYSVSCANGRNFRTLVGVSLLEALRNARSGLRRQGTLHHLPGTNWQRFARARAAERTRSARACSYRHRSRYSPRLPVTPHLRPVDNAPGDGESIAQR